MSTFDGAEASVDAQRKAALDALAQFGRRGLEAAVVAQKEGDSIQTDAARANTATGSEFNVGAAGQDALSAIGAAARSAYAADGAGRVALVGSENAAHASVNSNYYSQLRQAVPLARTASARAVDEYRAAYAERRAAMAAQAAQQQEAMRQAAAQTQMMQDQALRDQLLFGLQTAPLADPALSPFGSPYAPVTSSTIRPTITYGSAANRGLI